MQDIYGDGAEAAARSFPEIKSGRRLPPKKAYGLTAMRSLPLFIFDIFRRTDGQTAESQWKNVKNILN